MGVVFSLLLRFLLLFFLVRNGCGWSSRALPSSSSKHFWVLICHGFCCSVQLLDICSTQQRDWRCLEKVERGRGEKGVKVRRILRQIVEVDTLFLHGKINIMGMFRLGEEFFLLQMFCSRGNIYTFLSVHKRSSPSCTLSFSSSLRVSVSVTVSTPSPVPCHHPPS